MAAGPRVWHRPRAWEHCALCGKPNALHARWWERLWVLIKARGRLM